MKKSSLFVLCCLSFALPCAAQNLASQFQSMKNSYASSGSIVVLDDHTILIEPKMPGPLCAMPIIKDGKTTWVYYTFPLASIVVPLASVDETLIAEIMSLPIPKPQNPTSRAKSETPRWW